MGALASEARPVAPRLFALPGGARGAEPAPELVGGALIALPVVGAPPRPAPVAAPTTLRTLDELVGGLFGTLAAGRRTACALCGGVVRPRPVVAGTPAVGRCDGCGTDYEG